MAQLAHEVASGRACEVPAEPDSLLDRAWRGLTGSLRQGAAGMRGGRPTEPGRP